MDKDIVNFTQHKLRNVCNWDVPQHKIDIMIILGCYHNMKFTGVFCVVKYAN